MSHAYKSNAVALTLKQVSRKFLNRLKNHCLFLTSGVWFDRLKMLATIFYFLIPTFLTLCDAAFTEQRNPTQIFQTVKRVEDKNHASDLPAECGTACEAVLNEQDRI